MCLCHKILSSQVYSEDPDHIAPAAVVRLAYSITQVLGPDKTFFQFSIKMKCVRKTLWPKQYACPVGKGA